MPYIDILLKILSILDSMLQLITSGCSLIM